MTDQKMLSEGELATLRTLYAAYGADMERWPDAQREKWRAWCDAPQLAALRAEAALVDHALTMVTDPISDSNVIDTLNKQLLSDFDASVARQHPSVLFGISAFFEQLFFKNIFVPAGSAAAIAIAGIFSGMTTTADLSPEQEAYAYYSQSNDLYTADIEEIF